LLVTNSTQVGERHLISGPVTFPGLRIRNQHHGFVWAIAFSPEGTSILCSNSVGIGEEETKETAVIDVATGRRLRCIEHPFYLRAAFSPDGTTLALERDEVTIELWKTSTWEAKNLISHPQAPGSPFFWFPDGTLGLQGTKGITIWDPNGRRPILNFPGFALAVSLSGELLLTVPRLNHRGIELWETRTQRKVWSLDEPRSCATFSPDGKYFATTGRGFIHIWDIARMIKRESYKLDTNSLIESIAYSPDGKLLAAGDAGRPEFPSPVHVWDLSTGNQLGVWQTVECGVRQLTFSPDSRILAVAVQEPKGYVELWSVDEMISKKRD
jgi:WD40 repeat protein